MATDWLDRQPIKQVFDKNLFYIDNPVLGGACLTKTQAKARAKVHSELFLARVEASEANFRYSMAKIARRAWIGLYVVLLAIVLPQIYALEFIISVYEKARLKISVLSRRLYKWLLARISFF